MRQAPRDQGALGCLKAVLFDLLVVILSSFVWCAFLGPKGILIGIGQYMVFRFALFFERVFAPARRE